MSSYSVSDNFVPVHGGNVVANAYNSAVDFLAEYKHVTFWVIVALVIVLLCMWGFICVEKFNPTQTMRFQRMDGLGEKESLVGSFSYDPNAPASHPSSLAYQILHSPDFACSTRGMPTDDAWAWQNKVAREGARGGLTDSDFTKIASGY